MPHLRTFTHVAFAAIACLVFGCDQDDSSNDAGATPTADGKADHPEPEVDCTAHCETRDEQAVNGWCFSTAECVNFCEGASTDWTADDSQAFATCVEVDPLCFRTVDDCIETPPESSDECSNLCQARTVHEVDGWCYPQAECEADCQSGLGSGDNADAFATCVTDSPLCYQTVQQCMAPDASPPQLDCDATCAGRDDHAIDGWCFDSSECAAHCTTNAAAWSTTDAESFAACVGDDPLCFQTPEQCMMAQG